MSASGQELTHKVYCLPVGHAVRATPPGRMRDKRDGSQGTDALCLLLCAWPQRVYWSSAEGQGGPLWACLLGL